MTIKSTERRKIARDCKRALKFFKDAGYSGIVARKTADMLYSYGKIIYPKVSASAKNRKP